MVDQPLDPAIQANLLPDEQVLWTDIPDTSYLSRLNTRERFTKYTLVTFGLALLLVIWSSQGSAFEVGELIRNTLIISAVPLVILGGIALIWYRRQRTIPLAQPPVENPALRFVLTDRRVISHSYVTRASTSLFLVDARTEMNLLGWGYGEIEFFPPSKAATPKGPGNLRLSALAFIHLANVAEVHRLILEAQQNLTGDQPGDDFMGVLTPDEHVLWTGEPDVAYRAQRSARREIQSAVGIVLLFAVVFYVGGTLLGGGTINLPDLLYFIILLSALPLAGIALALIARFLHRGTIQPEQLPMEPHTYVNAVTDRRVLVYHAIFRSTGWISLADTDVKLKRRSQEHGNIRFFAQPHQLPDGKTLSAGFLFHFGDIAHAAEVYHLILAAQAQLRSS